MEIRIEHLSMTYPSGKQALKDLNLELKLITIAQERMRDKNLFNAFILASFLRSNNY